MSDTSNRSINFDILMIMWRGLSGHLRQVFASRLILYVIVFTGLLAVMVYHLGSSPSGLSSQELAIRYSSHNLSTILNQPINAPHNLLAYGLRSIGLNSNTGLRLSSVMFGLVFILSFYFLARNWFGKSIGLFGAVILAATPLFLITARQGSAEIMYFWPVPLMAVYAWLQRSNSNKDLAFLTLMVLCALSLYTPGLIWWLAGGLIICRKKLAEQISVASPPLVTTAILLGLLIAVPLGLSIAKDWTIIKPLALIPVHFGQPIEIGKHLAWMVLALFAKAPYHINLILGRLPILNIIQIALTVFGAYAMWNAARQKLLALVGGIVFAITVAGINNNISLLALGLPAFMVFIGAGLRYLYIEWRGVFPRNPVARSLAILLIGGVVMVNLLFGLRYSVVAWPKAMATKNTYVLK